MKSIKESQTMQRKDSIRKAVWQKLYEEGVMATPGLRDGFYELNPRHISIKRWTKAITTYGVTRWGRRLFTSYEEIGKIDLLIVTPTQVINIKTSIPRPQGIDWSHLNSKAIKRMRPLAELFKSIHT